MQAYFDQLDRVRYEGSKSSNPLAFRHYNPDELVLGKRMEEHLRLPPATGTPSAGTGRICLVWERLIVRGSSPVRHWRWRSVKQMSHLSFPQVTCAILLLPRCGCFPEGASLKEYINNFAQMVDVPQASKKRAA